MSDVAHAFIASPAVPARGAVHQLRRVGRLLRPRQAPPRARRPRQPRRPRQRLVADRLPHPRGRDLPLHPRRAQGRARQPHDLHPRVDPEADLLPLRARLPEQAPPLRLQHRPQLRLQPAQVRPARAARPGRDRGDPVLARRQRRAARSSTTWSRSRPRACSSGSATRCRRSPTTRSSATPTGSGGPSRRAGAERPLARAPPTGGTEKGPVRGPLFRKDVPPANPAAGSSVLQL